MPDIARNRNRIAGRGKHVVLLVTCLSGLNMPCLQSSTPPAGSPLSGQTPASGGYATEAECLQACREGACCEGTTCTVKPQCQCQGTGKVFKGVGTTCTPNPCVCPNAGTNLELGRCCFSGFTQSGEGGKTKSQCDALGGTWVAATPSANLAQNCASGCTSSSTTGIGNYTCLECNPLP
jgi:hypothetical protein